VGSVRTTRVKKVEKKGLEKSQEKKLSHAINREGEGGVKGGVGRVVGEGKCTELSRSQLKDTNMGKKGRSQSVKKKRNWGVNPLRGRGVRRKVTDQKLNHSRAWEQKQRETTLSLGDLGGDGGEPINLRGSL